MQQDADPFDLLRFVHAQNPVIDDVLSELRAGRKRSHWMWFVFPQIEGLGFSSMAQRYAIRSRAEAEAYLAHPSLATGFANASAWSSPLAVRSRRYSAIPTTGSSGHA